MADNGGMELHAVPIEPEGLNVIVGHAHFIKTVEDVHEALAGTSPHLRFGLAFCRGQRPVPVRRSGNDDELVTLAITAAEAIAAGHTFVVFVREGYPINVLNQVKAVPEVCTIHCATANPVEVLVAETDLGRASSASWTGSCLRASRATTTWPSTGSSCARSATSSDLGSATVESSSSRRCRAKAGAGGSPGLHVGGRCGCRLGATSAPPVGIGEEGGPRRAIPPQSAPHRSDPPAGGPAPLSSAPSGRDRRPPPRDTGSSEFSTGLTAEALAGRGESAHAGGGACGGMRWQSSWL